MRVFDIVRIDLKNGGKPKWIGVRENYDDAYRLAERHNNYRWDDSTKYIVLEWEDEMDARRDEMFGN